MILKDKRHEPSHLLNVLLYDQQEAETREGLKSCFQHEAQIQKQHIYLLLHADKLKINRRKKWGKDNSARCWNIKISGNLTKYI